VVVTGSSTAALTTTSIANGNNDAFVARYDANGNQTWIKQIQTLANNQSNAVSVDASGNVYIGGSVSGGVIGAGQVSQGKGDAFLAKYDSKGKLLAETQFGTSSSDSVAATATAADGSLYVASTQNGHAILSKYARRRYRVRADLDPGSGRSGGGRQHRRPHRLGRKSLCLGRHQQCHLTAAAPVSRRRQRRDRRFVYSATDNGASVSGDTGHLYRHFGH
jgi:hypothetical protein